MDQRPDEALMCAYGAGEAGAFDLLYARHKGGTYRYFLRHLDGDVPAAEELHQDLWLRVVGARGRYVPQAKFATWLYTLARHRVVDHWRVRHGMTLASLQDDTVAAQAEEVAASMSDVDDAPLHATIDAETARRLASALAEVPPLQRDAFLLHVEGGLPLVEIARLTDTSDETVKSRLRYAYRRLRARLEDLQ
jgi:RNA polymerase sigma-70 factor (ECF subfamily)